MVLEKLSDSLKNSLSKIKNSINVDRNLVEEIIKEIQKSLLSSDVNVRLVLEITKKIRQRAIYENNSSLNKKEHLITIIYEELTSFLGNGKEFELKKEQIKILLVGLYGQGKTTTCGKLGLFFKNRGKKVALISTDTYRPAALEQLKQLGEKIDVDVFGDSSLKDATQIFLKYEKDLENYDVILVDSAGRDFLNEELIDEISNLNQVVNPDESFLVIGADVGQSAQKQALAFKENVAISGVVITKMDGTGKGGGALSACSTSSCPVYFIGVGEKIDELEKFNSEKFVSQLLGMGDIETLLEKAKLALNEDKARNLQSRFMRGEFDLDDMYEQLKAMKKMGSVSKIMNLIPGMSSLKIDKSTMQVQEEKLEKYKFILDSMTKFEKRNPKQINISRIKRISKGCGQDEFSIRELLKHFKQTKKMFTMFKDPTNMENMENMQNMRPEEMMKMMKKSGMNLKKMKSMFKK